jgi:hypothetical protein
MPAINAKEGRRCLKKGKTTFKKQKNLPYDSHRTGGKVWVFVQILLCVVFFCIV